MLEVRDLHVRYGRVAALRGVSLRVDEGETVALIGANGAGKTTTLMAIAGALRPASGDIEFEGRSIAGLSPERIVRRGLSLAPEGRRIFSTLTVRENLLLGARPRGGAERLEELLERFPVLRARFQSAAGALSGGEQQQLALARALVSRPRLLLLDEPSLGLAPRLVDEIMELVAALHRDGQTILLVEQSVQQALEISDRAYVLRTGEVEVSGESRDLLRSELVEQAYLGTVE